MSTPLTILGIESSCDDTAAAVVRVGEAGAHVLASVVHGQDALHAGFGGVVPEIAARAHAEKIDIAVREALKVSGLGLGAMDAVAVTAGPGLIGGVLAGVMCAKGIAAGAGLPLVGVNHLAGHALTPRLTDAVAYPYLMLLVSGGHCQFLIVRGADDSCGWAAPSTTRPARRSTRWRACWACRSRAGRRWSAPPRWAIRRGSGFPGPCWTGRGATSRFRG